MMDRWVRECRVGGDIVQVGEDGRDADRWVRETYCGDAQQVGCGGQERWDVEQVV